MLKSNGEPFTVGRSRFLDRFGSPAEVTAKIYIKFLVNGLDATFFAQLDTGAAWSILEQEIAEAIGLLDSTGQPIDLGTRDGTISGQLVRLRVILLADEGESIAVQATVFVSREWSRGNFIGYSGLLERIRIGLDPQANYFYFGPAG